MCEKYIGNATKLVWKNGKINVVSMNIPCGSWRCKECAKRKAIILGNRVKKGFEGERIRFATFTDTGKGTLAQRLQRLKASWNRLRLCLSRDYRLTKFFWVLEFGDEKGRPHIHCLLNCYVPKYKLSALAKRCGFGKITDIRAVKDGGGFGYVFKYLHKDCGSVAGAQTLHSIRGRRFGVSRNIAPITSDDIESSCVTFSKGKTSAEVLKDRAEQIGNVIGEGTELEKKCENFVSYSVTKPQESFEKPVCKEKFTESFPTHQHISINIRNLENPLWRKWAENSMKHMEDAGASPFPEVFVNQSLHGFSNLMGR